MPLVYTPDLLFEGFSLSKVVLLDSQGREMPDGIIKGVRSSSWEPDIETFDEFSHEKLINVWSDIRRVNFSLEAGYTSMAAWAKITGSSIKSEPLITNLLTPNQASGGDALGNTSDLWGNNGWTVSRITNDAAQGSGCILATAGVTTYGGCNGSMVSGIAPGGTYTALASVRIKVGTRRPRITLAWFTAAEAWISQVVGSPIATGSGWAVISVTGVAPANAAKTAWYVDSPDNGAVGDAIAVDCVSIHAGAGGLWQMPGQPITGLTGLPSNYADRLPLYEHGRTNAAAFPVRLTFPARDANGKTQELALTLFKVKFQPPKQSGAEYKAGQSVSYQATAMLSATDETGALLDREAFGRIDRAYSVG